MPGLSHKIDSAASTFSSFFTGCINEAEVKEIDVSRIKDAENHPFSIGSDEELEELALSIQESGQQQEAVVRSIKDSDDAYDYEMLVGHRRKAAIDRYLRKWTGQTTIRARVLDCSDDEAAYVMTISNSTQRKNIKYSEIARAYALCKETEPGTRGRPIVGFAATDGKDAIVASKLGVSRAVMYRTIGLLKLIPGLLELVDNREILFIAAVNLSALRVETQDMVLAAIKTRNLRITTELTEDLKKAEDDIGQLNRILNPKVKSDRNRTSREKHPHKIAMKSLDRNLIRRLPDDQRLRFSELDPSVIEEAFRGAILKLLEDTMVGCAPTS